MTCYNLSIKLAIILPVSFILMSCVAIKDQDKQLLVADIDCTTADTQIAQLVEIRPTSAQKFRYTLLSISPPGALGGIVTGQYKDRAKIATGKQTKEIDQKIEKIKQTCKPPNSEIALSD